VSAMTGRPLRLSLIVVYATLIIVPVLVVLLGSLKTMGELFENPFALPAEWQVGNYVEVLTRHNMGRAFLNSTVVTLSSVTITLLLASMAAYAIARLRGWRSNLVFGFLILGMSVPPQVSMVPQFVLFNNLGLLDTLLGLVIINVATGLSVATFIMAGFMKTLPTEMFEAGAVDGVGPARMYRSIAIPLSLPSIAAAAIFLFVIQWNELLYPLLFIVSPSKETIPLTLLNFQGEFLTNYPLLFTGVVLASIPLTVAYVFLQKYFVEGMNAGAVKG
jgi:raffinose/stachyose/melibiose transport system permease protein